MINEPLSFSDINIFSASPEDKNPKKYFARSKLKTLSSISMSRGPNHDNEFPKFSMVTAFSSGIPYIQLE